jgi:hypothetical protein
MLRGIYTHTRCLWCLTGIALLGGALLACNRQEAVAQKDAKDPPKSEVKTKEIGKNVFLEMDGDKRRVLIKGIVCRRTDQLEQFLCRKMTKEHEAIVSADVDARHIHAALLVAGAEPGSPVKFDDKGNMTPAHGTKIKVFVEFEEKGKKVKVPAQQWVKNIKTKKELEHDWVFAGSFLIPNRLDDKAPPFYAANDGDVICLANFDSALLDLPITSSRDNDDLSFEAWTDRIPALETPVTVILEPHIEKKKK